MKCQKCSNALFLINIIPCCDDCSENAAWDNETEDYTLDEKVIIEKNLLRSRVAADGECEFSTAFGEGCYMFKCSICNHKTNLPIANSC